METFGYDDGELVIGLTLRLPHRLGEAIMRDAIEAGISVGDFLVVQLIQAENARAEAEAAEERFLTGAPLIPVADDDGLPPFDPPYAEGPRD